MKERDKCGRKRGLMALIENILYKDIPQSTSYQKIENIFFKPVGLILVISQTKQINMLINSKTTFLIQQC